MLVAARDRRFRTLYAALAAAAAAALAAALAAAGIEPFARALAAFDDAWFETVLQRCKFAFMSGWALTDVANVVPAVSCLAIAAHVARAGERAFLLAVAAVAAAGCAATFLGADLASNVLATNLQTYRALWLLAVATNAWAAVAASRLPPGTVPRRLLLAAMACGAVEHWVAASSTMSSFVFAAAALSLLRRRTAGRGGQRRWGAAEAAVPGFAAAALVFVLVPSKLPLIVAKHGVAGEAMSAAVLAGGIAASVLSSRRGWKPSPAAWGAALALLLGAAALSDRRTDWQRFIEEPMVPADLADFVADAGTVYWEAGLDFVWLKLRSPSHHSCRQGAGVMFFAGTAAEYRRRSEALSVLNAADFDDDASRFCPLKAVPGASAPATRAQIEAACRALPELDTLILMRPAPDLPGERWRTPAHPLLTDGDGLRRHGFFHKYRCAELR